MYGAMYMAVQQLVFGRLAHRIHGDLEMQRPAGHGVIAVESDLVALDDGDGDIDGALRRIAGKPYAEGELLIFAKQIPGNLLHQVWDALAIGVRWSDGHREIIPGSPPQQRVLQPGDQVSGPVQVDQWLSGTTGIQHFTFGVGKRVVNGDNGVGGDQH